MGAKKSSSSGQQEVQWDSTKPLLPVMILIQTEPPHGYLYAGCNHTISKASRWSTDSTHKGMYSKYGRVHHVRLKSIHKPNSKFMCLLHLLHATVFKGYLYSTQSNTPGPASRHHVPKMLPCESVSVVWLNVSTLPMLSICLKPHSVRIAAV